MNKSAKLGFAAVAGCMALSAHAQSWPTKPVKLITEIAPGGSSDVILRYASQEMQARIGQPLVLDHRPGANGIIALEACAKAAPDGYTLCMLTPAMVWHTHLFSKLPYDPSRDFRPIGRLYFQIQAVFARGNLQASTIGELQALAISKPGSLNMGTLGSGSLPDVFRLWISERWKTTIVGIPYKGGAFTTTALLAGDIDVAQMGLGSLSNAIGTLQSGRVKALAVSSAQRHKRLPSVPTLIEAGLEGAPGRVFWGVGGPAGLADAVVQRFNAEILRLYTDAKFIELHENFFLEPAPTTPEEFDAFLKAQGESAGMLAKNLKMSKQ
jgi:tripartite-type tricarboxylate transporter receptor subunit TctC